MLIQFQKPVFGQSSAQRPPKQSKNLQAKFFKRNSLSQIQGEFSRRKLQNSLKYKIEFYFEFFQVTILIIDLFVKKKTIVALELDFLIYATTS